MTMKSMFPLTIQTVSLTAVLSTAIVCGAWGQHISSEVDTLISRILNPKFASTDSTTRIIRELIAINQNEKSDYLNAQIKLLSARILVNQNKLDSARHLLRESEAFFVDDPQYAHSRDHGVVLLAQARVSNLMKEYGLAKMTTLEALTIFQRTGEKHYEKLALTGLGNLGVLTESFDEALKYYLEAQKVDLETGDRPDGSMTINLALVYNQMGQYEVALQTIRKSFRSEVVTEGSPRGFINLYSILASIHFNLKQYDSALLYHEMSRAVAQQLNIPTEIDIADFRLATFYSNTGNINRSNAIMKKLLNSPYGDKAPGLIDVQLLLAQNYYALGKYDSCVTTGSQALRQMGRRNVMETGIQLSTTVANAYEKMRRPDSAIFYFQQSSALKDSVYGPAKQQAMSSLYAEIETFAKQKEIRLLKKQADLHQAENQILVISIAFGTAITILTVSLLVLNYRHRGRKHELMNYELQNQLALRKNELHQQMLRIMYINDAMSEIEEKLKKLKSEQTTPVQAIQQALNAIHVNRTLEKEWDHFDNYFGNVHIGFFEKFNTRFPQLSIMERRLAGLVRMNLTNGQIAGILNIEDKSVKVAKHRLKKKLELNEEDDLNHFLQSFDNTSLSVERQPSQV